LKEYDGGLDKKDKWFVFNKIDLFTDKDLEEMKSILDKEIKDKKFYVSAKKNTGLKYLCNKVFEYIKE
ncbi:MAG: GTPase ObgE, partial [Pseudomonadota bacterium]|nr:GTPase ObgE [Pseudomonadota bacterium]